MKNLIIANWKMNPSSRKEAEELFEGLKKKIKIQPDAQTEVVICPPLVYLPLLKGLPLGAQNLFYEDKGAFTGEVSPSMLKDLGVEYVILGHSERRKYFLETNEIINKKIKIALEAGLKVIFCVGETAEEKETGKRDEVLQAQIQEGLKDIPDIENVNVAYEPVWAIGTGNNCSVEETKDSIEFIKKFVKKDTRIIYGGSVKSINSGAYVKEAGSNGFLVGGASLDAEEFAKIVQSAEADIRPIDKGV